VFRPILRAAVSAALLIFSGTSPLGAQGRPASGTLAGGVTYTVAADPAQPAAAIALWYRAPNAGFDTSPIPGLARLAAETVVASAPITGTSLGRLIAGYGGRLSVSAYPDSLAITALVPPNHAAETVRAMTGDFFAPVVTDRGLELAKRTVGEDAVFASVDPEETLEDALGASLFATGPLHDGTIATAQAIREASLAQVRGYAERAFRPGNAILVLTGNVDQSALRSVATRDGASPGAEKPATQRALSSPVTVRRRSNASGTGLGWIGPPIASEADATALDFVADAYFSPRTGIVAKALGARKATVTGKFVTYHDPGVFLVTISGDDAEAARPIVERVLADAAKPMDAKAFAAARASFVYNVLGSSSATPSDVADTVGWYAVEGNPAYAPGAGGERGRYLSLATALTPQSVARVVARYLGRSPGVVTLIKAASSSAEKTST
jgi:predicted Zn-dependent peptidase